MPIDLKKKDEFTDIARSIGMISPQGTMVNVPHDQLDVAKSSGYQLPNEFSPIKPAIGMGTGGRRQELNQGKATAQKMMTDLQNFKASIAPVQPATAPTPTSPATTATTAPPYDPTAPYGRVGSAPIPNQIATPYNFGGGGEQLPGTNLGQNIPQQPSISDADAYNVSKGGIVDKTASSTPLSTDYASSKEADIKKAEEEKQRLIEGRFTEAEKANIKQQADLSGRPYDQLIREAEEAKAAGLPSALLAGGRMGGFMNTQISGIGAFAQTSEGFFGVGGTLEKIKSSYDASIANLRVQKEQAVQSAELAAKQAMITGKAEDIKGAKDAYDRAVALHKAQLDEQTNAVKDLQQARLTGLSIKEKERNDIVNQLSDIGSVGGTVPDSLKSQADALMGAGFSDSYSKTAHNAFSAKTTEEQTKAAGRIADLMSKLPVGQTFKIGGETYTATGTKDLQFVQSTGADGHVHVGTFKPNLQTGQYEQVGQIQDLGAIGKPAMAGKTWTDPDTNISYLVNTAQGTLTPISAIPGAQSTGGQPPATPRTAADVNNVSGLKDPATGAFKSFNTPQESFDATVADIKAKQAGNTTTTLNADSNLIDFNKVWTGETKPGYTGKDLATQLQAQGLKDITEKTKISSIDSSQLAKAVAKLETGYNADTGTFQGQKAKVAKDYKQNGLIANTNYNPNNKLDSAAKLYIDKYIGTGKAPTSLSSIFGYKKAPGGINMGQIEERANNLITQATGAPLPDLTELQNLKKIRSANEVLLNKNELQADIITRNFDLAIQGEMTNDVNQNATIINRILNPIYLALGDPAVNQALVSNGTISQEFANLISIRNAQGTTVADKELGAELIRFGTSVEAQKAVVERLKAEAVNIQGGIQKQLADLWKQTDPLETSSQNPNRQAKIDQLEGIETKSDGSRWKKMPDGSYEEQ